MISRTSRTPRSKIKRRLLVAGIAATTIGGASAAAFGPVGAVIVPVTTTTTQPILVPVTTTTTTGPIIVPVTTPPPPETEPPPDTTEPPPPDTTPPPPEQTTQAPPAETPPAEAPPAEASPGHPLCSGWILFHGTVDPTPHFVGSIHVFIVMVDPAEPVLDAVGPPPGTLVFEQIPTTDDTYDLWVIAFHDVSEPYALIEHEDALALLHPDCPA